MFSAEFIHGCVFDIYKKLHAAKDPAEVNPNVFQRQINLGNNKAYGIAYDFRKGLIFEGSIDLEKGFDSMEINETGFSFIGQSKGDSLEVKRDFLREALDAMGKHVYMQTMGLESDRTLNQYAFPVSRRRRIAGMGN